MTLMFTDRFPIFWSYIHVGQVPMYYCYLAHIGCLHVAFHTFSSAYTLCVVCNVNVFRFTIFNSVIFMSVSSIVYEPVLRLCLSLATTQHTVYLHVQIHFLLLPSFKSYIHAQPILLLLVYADLISLASVSRM